MSVALCSLSRSALVLFSGGQDSTTCLAWALSRYKNVETIGFNYGQRHAIELKMRPILLEKMRRLFNSWDHRLGTDHVIDLQLIIQASNTALINDIPIIMQKNNLPNTFIPGRNLLFMVIAATIAYKCNLDILIGGMCEIDYSGYPDCRDDTIKALQVALNLGMATQIKLETPLMSIDKAGIWQLAYNLGGQKLVDLIRCDTHTCYLGIRNVQHSWGYGCNKCIACNLRARGYRKYSESLKSISNIDQ